MRKSILLVAASLVLLVGCVTINVYFPAAAAQKAAEKFIGNVIGPDNDDATPPPASSTQPPASGDSQQGAPAPQPLAMRLLDAVVPAANAAETQPDLTVRTPGIEAIQARMRARFRSSLKGLLASGAVGFTHNGDVAVRDASKIPLADRSRASQVVAAENKDRAELYKQIAEANGHPEWASRMREAFAKQWIEMARSGWYYQDASGNWKQK